VERARTFRTRWDEFGAATARRCNIQGWTPASPTLNGYAVRCTAVPGLPVAVPDITNREDLKIGLQPVLRVPQNAFALPMVTESAHFRPVLRSWVYNYQAFDSQFDQLARGDGVLESTFMHIAGNQMQVDREEQLPVEYLFALAFGMIFSVERFRLRTGTEAVPYQIELEILSLGPKVTVLFLFNEASPGSFRLIEPETVFPRYLVEDRARMPSVVDTIQSDVWNSMGRRIDENIRKVEVNLPFMLQEVVDRGQ
jgi:hypothetical protein